MRGGSSFATPVGVDDHFRTKVPSIYAIGDVIPGRGGLSICFLET
jgi:pyruvate/2-oxoglutarate dehydrogenase complex dihydrolipoamide dehydrogenase (E3) component